jgi:integration host factor subunit alpha
MIEVEFTSIQAPTLTKADLVAMLCEQIGLNRRESNDMANAFFGLVFSTLARGEEVKLSSFGNFLLNTKKGRLGRNPRTGQPARIAARTALTFRACKGFKAQINEASAITRGSI